jgi:hypothetical protein
MNLGRKHVGDSIKLELTTLNASGVAVLPDAAPIVNIYNATGTLQMSSPYKLPVVFTDRDDSATLLGFFSRRLVLTTSLTAGRYTVLYEWTISSARFHRADYFDVVTGGSTDGTVHGAFSHNRPETKEVHYDTESGKILVGRNPS